MTYQGVPVFMVAFADLCEWGLRRYVTRRYHDGTSSYPEGVPECAGRYGYHDATVILGQHPAVALPDNDGHVTKAVDERTLHIDWPADDDQRWPTGCDHCGWQFRDEDTRQHWTDMLYRRGDNGELTTLRAAPPGAMWDAFWYPWKGPDGLSLVVKCPNGREWTIDGRASNCTQPDDHEHRCWVRHGTPPAITVDKNGPTCQAGAGSIQAGGYHGFLRDGRFTDG